MMRNEDGSANLFAFLIVVPLLLFGFLFVWHTNTAKDARKGFDEKVMQTAKAAASQTYTTTDGLLRIDFDEAAQAAKTTYDLYKPFVRDNLGYSLLNPTVDARVSVDCKPAPDEGCLGVTVSVEDQYRGTVFTSGMFSTYDLRGRSSADLVISE